MRRLLMLVLLCSCGENQFDANADGVHQMHCHGLVTDDGGRWRRCENDEVVCYVTVKGISCLNKREL